MRKQSITSIFGIVGIVSWSITIFLREEAINSAYLNFILGVMPNISAAWFFIWVGEIISNIKKYNFNFKIASRISGVIFILALISEIIHDLFLNSPFDIYDIIGTVLSIILYLVTFYFFNNLNIDKQS